MLSLIGVDGGDGSFVLIELAFVFVGHILIYIGQHIEKRICKCVAMRVSLPTSWF